MRSLSLKCNTCKGSGSVKLSDPHRRTALLFKRKTTRLTAAEVRQLLGDGDVTVNAINVRLEYLRRAGFLNRERDGKSFYYFSK